ncbi:MAG: recombination-associated protein RdgC [Acidiferrobacterales bacterium]|nr:recombination-associated protein RdgC [Acidiferrobacterales bacterium]
MWFKNLRIYRCADVAKYTPEALNEALAKFEFTPCGGQDALKTGWVPPLGRQGTEFVHAANGYVMICVKRQEKVLPSSIVKEFLDEKVAEISEKEARKVGRAEKQNLKEEIIFTLMPKAFVKSSYDFAYIDTQGELIVINSSSANRAEELLVALREALGSLKAVPLTPFNSVREVLTGWLTGDKLPEQLEIGQECELTSLEEGRSIKFKHQDLWADEIRQHIGSALQVAKLAFKWNDSIECIVDDQFSFKRIRYSSEVTSQADDFNADSAAAKFDNEFSVMTIELSAFIKAMSEAFGGVNDSNAPLN